MIVETAVAATNIISSAAACIIIAEGLLWEDKTSEKEFENDG